MKFSTFATTFITFIIAAISVSASSIEILDLPEDKNSLLELVIINTTKKDISFVIIDN